MGKESYEKDVGRMVENNGSFRTLRSGTFLATSWGWHLHHSLIKCRDCYKALCEGTSACVQRLAAGRMRGRLALDVAPQCKESL